MPEHRTAAQTVRRPWGRRSFLPLFLILSVCLAVLCAAFAWLFSRYRWQLQQERELSAQLAQARSALSQQEDQLAQARELIEQMAAYSLLKPDGTPPDHAALYPEMYAQPWEGPRVSGEKTVYLTFDDGPSVNTDRILAVLEEYGIKATFFIVGKTDQNSQRRMQEIVAAGHTLAIHSWSHDYKKIYASVEAYLDDFHQLYQWIYEVTGSYPQIFRFPGGSINGYDRGIYQEIIAEMTRRGFVYFDWNASAQDATVKPLAPAVILDNCAKGIGKETVVVLAHDTAARGTTVEALPAIIQRYRDAGYTFRPLDPGSEQIILGYPKEH